MMTLQCVLLLRTPDLSEARKDSKASRYIIYSMPTSYYLIENKINMTLQAMHKRVVDDLNALATAGIETADGVSCQIRVWDIRRA